MAADDLFTREEALAGLPARRASTLLFLIESRTAHLVARSRQAMERFLTEEAAQERDLAFFEAFSQARQPPVRPTIQDLERYAPQWTHLVPDSPRLRAALAHALGQKYAFTHPAVPGIRAALGLDEEPVQQAYQRLYGQSLATIYAPRAGLLDRVRWFAATFARRLESLPPFWTAFALTLTETVGAGILALPIALAGVGPLVGVVLLVLLGLVNVLTIAYMAEAVARSGAIRYGRAFIGRVVADYLGNAGSLVLTLGLATICFIALLAYYVGFSSTLADITPVPPAAWAAVLFLGGLYFLYRKSLSATVASALVVGAINIGLILALSLLAFAHVRPANLLYVNVPFLHGQPFDASILQLVFGVVLTAYFGHLSVSNCAQVVLRRDPSARGLIWGNIAAMATAMILYCIWVLAVNGAVGSQVMADQSGTALAPLAAQVGPLVHVLGTVFVILGMGMASIHSSLGLANLVRERLPALRRPEVLLPKRRGQLILHRRGRLERPGVVLTYQGLEAGPGPHGQPRFRLDWQSDDDTHSLEVTIAGRWDAATQPDLDRHGVRLVLEVLDAGPESVRVQVTTPLAVTYAGEWDTAGLHMADLLTLRDDLRPILTWMMRRGPVSPAEIAAHTGQDEPTVRATLETLAEDGLVQRVAVEGVARYQARLAHRRRRALPQGLQQVDGGETARPAGERTVVQPARRLALGERGRSLLAALPVVGVFGLTEWLYFSGTESFAGPLGFLGVIVISLLGGIFPVLLLISSRRKGEYVPSVVYRFLGHPVLLGGIYLLSLASLFLHGLVIWEGLGERAVALAVGLLMLGLTVVMIRRGAFTRRLVMEVRQDREDRGTFAVTAAGKPIAADVRLGYSDGEQHRQTAGGELEFLSLRHVTIEAAVGQMKELKAWAHRITPEGNSEALPAQLQVCCGPELKGYDLRTSGGQVVLPLVGETCRAELRFPDTGEGSLFPFA